MVTVAVQNDVDVVFAALMRPTPDEAERESVEEISKESDQPRVRSATPPRHLPAQRIDGEAEIRTNAPDQVCKAAEVMPRALVKEARKDLVESWVTDDSWHLSRAELASPFLIVLGNESPQRFFPIARLMQDEHPVAGAVDLAEPDSQQVTDALDLLDVQAFSEVPDILESLQRLPNSGAVIDVHPAVGLAGTISVLTLEEGARNTGVHGLPSLIIMVATSKSSQESPASGSP